MATGAKFSILQMRKHGDDLDTVLNAGSTDIVSGFVPLYVGLEWFRALCQLAGNIRSGKFNTFSSAKALSQAQ